MGKRTSLNRLLVGIGILGTLIFSAYAGMRYLVYSPIVHIKEDHAILIHPNATHIDSLIQDLSEKEILPYPAVFKWISNMMSFQPLAGKYLLPKGQVSHRDLIGIFRGKQMTINLAIHNHRTIDQLTVFLADHTTINKIELDRLLSDRSYLDSIGFTKDNVMSLFIPNTYQFYWNMSAQTFMDRMIQENKRFWNTERIDKLGQLNLTAQQVYTLASIVECETQYKPERRRIAGVYMNRLQKRGWKLEADPTVIFAIGDFSIRRLLKRHLSYDSPYNTYKYAGLPPGPIFMSSIHSIDAVLDYEKHDFMFFCAKPKDEGRPTEHAFAKTLQGHLVNARKYQRWIRSIN